MIMKQLSDFENIWGKILTKTGKNFVITFSIKDRLYRLYCLNAGDYQCLDKSKDAIKLLKKHGI